MVNLIKLGIKLSLGLVVLLAVSACNLNNLIEWNNNSEGPGDESATPTHPTSLEVNPVDESTIELSWSGSTSNMFIVLYKAGSSPPSSCSDSTATVFTNISGNSYTLGGLNEGGEYSFLICATEASGEPSIPATGSGVTNYCLGDRLTNTPYANSGETGIDGTSELKAFSLCTAEQWNQIGLNTSDHDKYFIIKKDLDFSALDGSNYNTIQAGLIDPGFDGHIDGNYKSIVNMDIDYSPTGAFYQGLMGKLNSGASLKNLAIVNGNISMNRGGALVGAVYGTLSTSYFTGTINLLPGTQQVGGLASVTANGATIENCYVQATISGSSIISDVAGLVAGHGGDLLNSYFVGSINTDDHHIAGIVSNNSGHIDSTFAIADITGRDVSAPIDISLGVADDNLGWSNSDVYFDSSKTCTNLSAGSCSYSNTGFNTGNITTGVDVSLDSTYFYAPTNLPLSNWNFTTIWKSNLSTNGYPTLQGFE